MKCIADFIDRLPLISLEAAVGDVAERFSAFASAPLFPVANGDRIVGVIHRQTIEMALRAGPVAGGVRHLIAPDPLIVDSGADVRAVLDAALRDPRRRGDGVVVVEADRYVGMAALDRALDALLDDVQPAADARTIAAQVLEEFSGVVQAAQAEFRGQIDGLLAMADRLGRQHLNPDAAAQVRSIRSTGETLLRIAEDSRDMLLARQGRLELSPTPQRLRELIDNVQERWAARAADIGVSLLISYDGHPDLSAVIDANRLIQVFDNLIDNALRYTRRGSVEVSLRARPKSDQVMLEGRVRDTGPGLAGADLARIFDIGTDALGSGGSLPLLLTRGIVLAMQGSVRADSNPGQGMTVSFDMVVGRAKAASAPAPAQITSVTGSPHILVVDDNATNRMVAEALCEMFDCTSETAEDGVAAVEAARAGRFDLILMDIKMPRMDGVAATLAIRALDGPAGAVPIVALTANVDADDARDYLAAGMCAVVEKPIKPDRLLQAIKTALASQTGSDAVARVAAA